MRVNKLELHNYRNIDEMIIEPCKTINVIYGENAQGKTNIIEAIWIFTGNNSFRGSKPSELISFDKEYTQMEINFEDENRCQDALILYSDKKKFKLNQVELKGLSEFNGKFYAVVFSPVHLSLIKEGPKNRRKFIDIAISQIKPQYKSYLGTYEKLIEQRNALLKSSNIYPNLNQEIDVWDIQISKIGTIISIYRNDYIKKLLSFSKEIYKEISGERESFSMKYISTIYENIKEVTVYDEKYVELYYKKLKESFNYDIKQGSTSCGIHRDDLDIFIDGHSVKTYGSQGQQRSVVISLKLSEARLLKKATGEDPIMLLDDVMSELDEARQEYILNHLKGMQVFITCCDVNNAVNLEKGKLFNIKKGKIMKIKDIII